MQTFQDIDFDRLDIVCERVRLRSISHDYHQTIFEEFTDEITRYMIPATPSRIEEIEDFIASSLENMANKTDIVLVILDKHSGEFLGVCGVHGGQQARQPILGIWLKKSAHGQRYGQEAIRGLVDWCKNHIELDYLVYPCDKDNIASRKIPEHLNGKIFRQGQIRGMGGKILNEVAYKIE